MKIQPILENRLDILARRTTTMFVVVIFGWIVNVYPGWQIDAPRFSFFCFYRWKLTGGFTLHAGLFGVRVQPYKLTCPSCGGHVSRFTKEGYDVCVEPGSCLWHRPHSD